MAANLCQSEIRQGAAPSAGDTQKKGRLTIQCDELWSFVDNKDNKRWVWLALDADTREIVGVYIGARDEAAARKLWESLSPVYRQWAVSGAMPKAYRIYGFLGSIWGSSAQQTASGGWKRNRQNQLH